MWPFHGPEWAVILSWARMDFFALWVLTQEKLALTAMHLVPVSKRSPHPVSGEAHDSPVWRAPPSCPSYRGIS